MVLSGRQSGDVRGCEVSVEAFHNLSLSEVQKAEPSKISNFAVSTQPGSVDQTCEPTSNTIELKIMSRTDTVKDPPLKRASCPVTEGHDSTSSKHVLLRAEFMTQNEVKVNLFLVFVLLVLGNASLWTLFIMKARQDSFFFFRHLKPINAVNLAVACWNVATLGFTIIAFVSKFVSIHRLQLKWTARRLHAVQLLFLEVVVQFINSCAYLVPNALMLANSCSWSSPVVRTCAAIRWICWAVIFTTSLIHAQSMMPLSHFDATDDRLLSRLSACLLSLGVLRHRAERRLRVVDKVEDGVMLDLPLWTHAPKLMLCVPPMVLSVLLAVLGHSTTFQTASSSEGEEDVFTTCGQTVLCAKSSGQVVLSLITLSFFIAQSVMVSFVLGLVIHALVQKPYERFRFAHVSVRMMMRNRMTVFVFFGLTMVLLWLVKYEDCNTIVASWFGFQPMQLVIGGFMFILAWQHMPITPRPGLHAVQDLQRCVWAEADKEDEVHRHCSSEEALFCFETMLKLFYWSRLVYRIDQEEEVEYTKQTAMQLYGVDKFEVVWDQTKDTKGIIGWGGGVIVLAFRGTASMENILTDAQAWQGTHPPARGSGWLGTRPRAHKGFLSAWLTNEYNAVILRHVRDILQQQGATRDTCPTIYVTGHSLGGALASLAAFEIVRELGDVCRGKVVCYTFGAPRVGNHAFVREYDGLVPDTWHVINDQDIVTRAGKLFGLYKRSPRRVLLIPDGTMVVRPSFLEINMYKNNPLCGQGSASQHMLGSYLNSIREALIIHHCSSATNRQGISAMLCEQNIATFLEQHAALRVQLLKSQEAQPRDALIIQSKEEGKKKSKLRSKVHAKKGGDDDDTMEPGDDGTMEPPAVVVVMS